MSGMPGMSSLSSELAAIKAFLPTEGHAPWLDFLSIFYLTTSYSTRFWMAYNVIGSLIPLSWVSNSLFATKSG